MKITKYVYLIDDKIDNIRENSEESANAENNVENVETEKIKKREWFYLTLLICTLGIAFSFTLSSNLQIQKPIEQYEYLPRL